MPPFGPSPTRVPEAWLLVILMFPLADAERVVATVLAETAPVVPESVPLATSSIWGAVMLIAPLAMSPADQSCNQPLFQAVLLLMLILPPMVLSPTIRLAAAIFPSSAASKPKVPDDAVGLSTSLLPMVTARPEVTGPTHTVFPVATTLPAISTRSPASFTPSKGAVPPVPVTVMLAGMESRELSPPALSDTPLLPALTLALAVKLPLVVSMEIGWL